MKSRSLVIALCILLAALAAAPASGTQARRAYSVTDMSASALQAAGYEVIDDYGALVTARFTDDEAAQVQASGAHLELLKFRTGHAAHWHDYVAEGDLDIPLLLRAPTTSPYQIVQFRGPIRDEWRAHLDQVGTVYAYLPEFSYVAKLSSSARETVRGWPEVRSVMPYHPAFKLDLPDGSGVQRLAVTVYNDVAMSDAASKLSAVGFTETSRFAGRDHVFFGTIQSSKINDVARLKEVLRIENGPQGVSLDNGPASSISQAGWTPGANLTWPLNDRGIDGSTQKIEVCDSGINTANYNNVTRTMDAVHEMDADPTTKIVFNANLPGSSQPPHRKIDLYFSPVDPTGLISDHTDAVGHGTHVAATAAGDAPPYGVRGPNDGVAYASKLVICDIYVAGELRPIVDYSQMYQPGFDRGARVVSNSWGAGDSRAYTTITRQNDMFAYEHPEFLIVRSQGNTGMPSMRVDAVAKNIVAVGATQNVYSKANPVGDPDSIYWLNETLGSSWGPTLDGRIKPNIVAPGDCVRSAFIPNATSYDCLRGTSMSTPQVAAAAALIRDYFAKGYYPSGEARSVDARNVSAALLRAILQISGREISGDRGVATWPNEVQGWGRLALDDGLFFKGEKRKLIVVDESTILHTGSVVTKQVRVKTKVEPLRVMVAWRDPPALGCALPALCDAQPNLVNDLDLVVTGPHGERYIGNAFVNGQTPSGVGVRDARNVEEAVYVNVPAVGVYTVTITGVNVPASEGSTFALAVTGDVTG